MAPPSPRPQSSAQQSPSEWEVLSPCDLKLSSEQPLPFFRSTALPDSRSPAPRPTIPPVARACPRGFHCGWPRPLPESLLWKELLVQTQREQTHMACGSLCTGGTVSGTEKVLGKVSPRTLTHPPDPKVLEIMFHNTILCSQ